MISRVITTIALIVTLLLLGACRSAPTQFYTLDTASVPPLTDESRALPYYRLDGVKVPASVDRPQLVLSLGKGQVALMENALWLAPLPDEIRAAIDSRLGERQVAAALPQTEASSPIRIGLQIDRFVSELNQQAWLQADWQIRQGKHVLLRCRGDFRQPADSGMMALVVAHQHNIARLADSLAATLLTLDETPACQSL